MESQVNLAPIYRTPTPTLLKLFFPEQQASVEQHCGQLRHLFEDKGLNNTAQRIRLLAAAELFRRAEIEKASIEEKRSPEFLKGVLQRHFLGVQETVFGAAWVTSNGEIVVDNLFRIGTTTTTNGRAVVRQALHRDAVAVLFADNRPDGALHEGAMNSIVGTGLRQALHTIGVSVIGHVIVNDDECRLFKE